MGLELIISFTFLLIYFILKRGSIVVKLALQLGSETAWPRPKLLDLETHCLGVWEFRLFSVVAVCFQGHYLISLMLNPLTCKAEVVIHAVGS